MLHYQQPDHVRWYGRSDFDRRLRAEGLDPEAWRVGDRFAADVTRFALDPEEVFFLARPVEHDGARRSASVASR